MIIIIRKIINAGLILEFGIIKYISAWIPSPTAILHAHCHIARGFGPSENGQYGSGHCI